MPALLTCAAVAVAAPRPDINALNLEAVEAFRAQRYGDAERLWKKAINAATEVGRPGLEVDLVGNLRLLYKRTGDPTAELPTLERAIGLARKLDRRDKLQLWLSRLGQLRADAGLGLAALKLHIESLRLAEQASDAEGVRVEMSNIGRAQYEAGNLTKAAKHISAALELNRREGTPTQVGNDLLNLAAVYWEIGSPDRAVGHLREAVRKFKSAGDEAATMSAMKSLAELYGAVGDLPAALEWADQLETLGEGRGSALAHYVRGIAHWSGGNPDAAAGHLAKTCPARGPIGGQPCSSAVLMLLDVYIESGVRAPVLDRVEIRLRDPLRKARLLLQGGGHKPADKLLRAALAEEEASARPRRLFGLYVTLGRAAEGWARPDEAVEFYGKAVELVERTREALHPAGRRRFLRTAMSGVRLTDAYEGLVRALVGSGDEAAAFAAAESLKARALSERLISRVLPPRRGPDRALARRERKLVVRLAESRRRADQALLQGDAARLRGAQRALKTARTALASLVHKLRAKAPAYAALRYPVPVRPAGVVLKQDEALVAFEVTASATYAFVLHGGALRTHRWLVSREELTKKVQAYRSYFDDVERRNDLRRYSPAEGLSLYDKLFGGLLEGLMPNQAVIIIPDESLALLPFEALVAEKPTRARWSEGRGGRFLAGVRYLGDLFSITYSQSATAYMFNRARPKRASTGRLLVVADPVFDASDERLTRRSGVAAGAKAERGEASSLASAINRWKQMGPAGVRRRRDQRSSADPPMFARLPATGQLAATLRKLYKRDADVFTGMQATEGRLRSIKLSDYGAILFATHGLADDSIPRLQQPTLVLGQIGNESPDDGFITMNEVFDLRLNADIVVLTACETGVGRYVRGEGVMGLGRAFQYAGARSVLMSLWKVSEEASVMLVEAFLKALRDGQAPAAALAVARASIRSQGYEHPFYWAPFVLVGSSASSSAQK